MKAAQIFRYNRKDIRTTIREIEKPIIRPNEVLVRVHAAGVNPLDNLITRGEVKLVTPYRMPLTLGNEIAGVVETVGSTVTAFVPGDRVYARLPIHQIGAFAEWVAVPSDALAMIPDRLSFIEAASVPLVALTAYQALELLDCRPGESLFISGASGGVGTMAVPLAKERGLVVYANGSAENKDRVLALGADRYFDYKTEDYAQLGSVNHVLDSIGGDELMKQMNLLRRGGSIVSLRGLPNGRFAKDFGLPLWKQWLLSLAGMRLDQKAERLGAVYHFLFVRSSGAQLTEISRLIDERGISPSVDRVYPFEQVNEALAKVATGRSQGKTVIAF